VITRRDEQGRNLVLRDHADPRLLAAHDALHRGDVKAAHNFIHSLLFIEKEEELDQRIVAIIYGAADPRSKELKYIGKTRVYNGDVKKSLSNRRTRHLNISDGSRRSEWMLSLRMENIRPDFFVIEPLTTVQSWQEAERFYIAYFRSLGCQLVNTRDGGGGESLVPNPPRNVHLNVRVPAGIRKLIDKAAIARNISMGDFVRESLEIFLRQRGTLS
jgi:hypothetical protein